MSETLKLADNLLQIAVATVSRGATSPGRAVLHSPNAEAQRPAPAGTLTPLVRNPESKGA